MHLIFALQRILFQQRHVAQCRKLVARQRSQVSIDLNRHHMPGLSSQQLRERPHTRANLQYHVAGS